jgi:hypothetical protein
MNRSGSRKAEVVIFCGMLVCLMAQAAKSAELKKETANAFERYVAASERRTKSEFRDGPFLFMDALPETRRTDAYLQLRQGAVLVQQVNTKEEGHPIEVPHGLIHDWVGVLFIPGASLEQSLAVMQDYANYQNIYKPEVRRSKLLSRNGDHFNVFLQLSKKSLITVAINADFDIVYERLGTRRAVIRSSSTRLAEVEDVGQAEERELPEAGAHGYVWRLLDYWRFEEKDGGVYVQLESIALSRSVPAVVGWLINPLLRSIPRGTLLSLLVATRAAIASKDLSPTPLKELPALALGHTISGTALVDLHPRTDEFELVLNDRFRHAILLPGIEVQILKGVEASVNAGPLSGAAHHCGNRNDGFIHRKFDHEIVTNLKHFFAQQQRGSSKRGIA